MTDIEQKALELVNAVRDDRGYHPLLESFSRKSAETEALCRAIEQHEAFRQEVSDAVEDTKFMVETHCDTEALALVSNRLNRFILPEPDPLVEAVAEMLNLPMALTDEQAAHHLRDALDARGLAIVKKEAV